VGQILFIPTQHIKTSGKNIEREIASISSGKKTRCTLPIGQIDLYVVNSLFKQQVVAPYKKFILQRLFGVSYLWPGMFNKILDFSGVSDLYSQNSSKYMPHYITEAMCNFMGIDKQHNYLLSTVKKDMYFF
jgi:hypothetical protein